MELLTLLLQTATPTETPQEDGGKGNAGVINAIESLIDAVTSFENNLGEILLKILYKPFQLLANAIIDLLTYVMVSYPDVTRWEVLEIHRLLFQLELLLATPVLLGIGYIYLTGSLFGYGPRAVRPLLPRLVLAIGFGAVAPWLLQYPVQLSQLVTEALRPENPDFWAATRVTMALAVITILNSALLLAVAVLFLVRDFVLMWCTATAPLLALGLVLPFTERYAQRFIGAFWSFLLIGPVDMIAFRLVLLLLETQGNEIPHWLWAFAGLLSLAGLPLIVLSSGLAITGTALGFIGGTQITPFPETSKRPRETWSSQDSGNNRFTNNEESWITSTPEHRLSNQETPMPLWHQNDPSNTYQQTNSSSEDEDVLYRGENSDD